MSNNENEFQEIPLEQLIRTFKREGIENFITIRRNKYDELVRANDKRYTKLRDKRITRRKIERREHGT